MSDLFREETRFGEGMVRSSVSADLGHLLLAGVTNKHHRILFEEAIVSLAHDMFEAGQTEGRISAESMQADAYLQGLADAMRLNTEGGEA